MTSGKVEGKVQRNGKMQREILRTDVLSQFLC